ncbi:hypothetical protein [Streptomyces liangshanensis]|uniref:hypothetical protein n=1 Tax=Streptomyces liangshanensis TaxID=2717324 RepID=UPI0036D86F99
MRPPSRGPVYGTDYDNPDPGPQPGGVYRKLVCGSLDGLLLDVTGWTEDQLREGAALITEIGAYGPGGRTLHGQDLDRPGHMVWEGRRRP